eukprot:5192018-Amphidinium_carterae.1
MKLVDTCYTTRLGARLGSEGIQRVSNGSFKELLSACSGGTVFTAQSWRSPLMQLRSGFWSLVLASVNC